MKLSLAVCSLSLFCLSIILLLLLTLFESALVGISPAGERLVTLLGLVLPAGIGTTIGMMSLVRKEGRAALAITGIVLNALFALFHLMIIFFAG